MYYICSHKGDNFGIKDTSDGVIEYYNRREVLQLSEKLEIVGVENGLIFITDIPKNLEEEFSSSSSKEFISKLSCEYVVTLTFSRTFNRGGCKFKSNFMYEIRKEYGKNTFIVQKGGLSSQTKWYETEDLIELLDSAKYYSGCRVYIKER